MVPGVTLTLMCAGTEPRSEVSDEQGRFRFEDVPTGDCSVVADLQGFKPATEGLLVRPSQPREAMGCAWPFSPPHPDTHGPRGQTMPVIHAPLLNALGPVGCGYPRCK